MKVNGIDIRRYNAKQLTVDVQPPTMLNRYEWINNASLPTELETDVNLGHLNLSIYFKGKDRNSIIRTASEFMMNFKKPCVLELDGYKGKYKGFLTENDYEKKRVKDRYIINMVFDGYFYDDELSVTFDGKTSAQLHVEGTRDTPCIIEVLAKKSLDEYKIEGLGDIITIEHLDEGKTLIIDGVEGLVTVDGENAFHMVDIWEFPKLCKRKELITFSNENARVTIRYEPMWI